jgi:DNA-binding MarR family transcriptional regulator
LEHLKHDSPAAWVKRYYMASRAVMEASLRPYGLGSSQWYVLWQLANQGPTPQRDFLALLSVEKPALSEIVSAVVRKGLVAQTTSASDQRQRVLSLTPEGLALWQTLPDPIALILGVSFDGVDAAELATVVRVLGGATARLMEQLSQPSSKGNQP